MFGKLFQTMFSGSLYGCGALRFAVMSYVVAYQQPDRVHGSVVELNPKMLADTLGEKVEEVEQAIKFLCSPDPGSRNKDEEGRRLVELGGFLYRVVNGARYRAVRSQEERRMQVCEAQRRHRAKKLPVMISMPAVPKGVEVEGGDVKTD